VRSRIPDLSRLRRTISFRAQYELEAIIREVVEQARARQRR
jgi:hypothetical protein